MTVKVVFQEAETVLIVKIVEDSDNKNVGYNGTYVYDTSIRYLPCLFAPLRRIFTKVLPVPGTCASFVRLSYPYPKPLGNVVFCGVDTESYPGYFPGYYPTKNFCKFCTPMPQYRGYRYIIFIPIRNFGELCNTSVPVPGTPANSVRRSYLYLDLL